MKQMMKFVKWEGKNAYFRKATLWERFKASWKWYWTRTPDPKNLIVNFTDMDKATAWANAEREKRESNRA